MGNRCGYEPIDINYCTECGSQNIDIDNHWQGNGLLRCGKWGLQCYIVEGDGSHREA